MKMNRLARFRLSNSGRQSMSNLEIYDQISLMRPQEMPVDNPAFSSGCHQSKCRPHFWLARGGGREVRNNLSVQSDQNIKCSSPCRDKPLCVSGRGLPTTFPACEDAHMGINGSKGSFK